jgi:hypothetical protein
MAIGPLPSCPAIPIFAGFLLASLTVLGGNSGGQSARFRHDSGIDSGMNRHTILVHQIGARIAKSQNRRIASGGASASESRFCFLTVSKYIQVE